MGGGKNKKPGPFIRLAALPLGPRFLIYRRFAVASSVVFREAIVHEVSTWGGAIVKTGGIYRYDAFFGALTEDSQHFSWEGMMRCMTVGLWPSGIFFILQFYSLLTHFLIHYGLVTRT